MKCSLTEKGCGRDDALSDGHEDGDARLKEGHREVDLLGAVGRDLHRADDHVRLAVNYALHQTVPLLHRLQ